MELVWKYQESSVRQVWSILRKKRQIAYTTVMTIMSRLADKGLLRRRLEQSGAYGYTPAPDQREYLEIISKKAVTGLIKDFGALPFEQVKPVVDSLL